MRLGHAQTEPIIYDRFVRLFFLYRAFSMNQNAEYSAVNDAVRGQFFRKVWAMTRLTGAAKRRARPGRC
jgi:hypothetical protein